MRIFDFLSRCFCGVPAPKPTDGPTDSVEEVESLALAAAWNKLRQRVVEELRREYYGTGLPWHLRIIEASGLVNDENVYDRNYDRLISDIVWCAELFGEDPAEFKREVLTVQLSEVAPDWNTPRSEIEKS